MLSGLTNGRQINCLRTKTSIGTKGAEEDGKGESERDVSSSRREKWRVAKGGGLGKQGVCDGRACTWQGRWRGKMWLREKSLPVVSSSVNSFWVSQLECVALKLHARVSTPHEVPRFRTSYVCLPFRKTRENLSSATSCRRLFTNSDLLVFMYLFYDR